MKASLQSLLFDERVKCKAKRVKVMVIPCWAMVESPSQTCQQPIISLHYCCNNFVSFYFDFQTTEWLYFNNLLLANSSP